MEQFEDIVSLDISMSDEDTDVVYLGSTTSESSGINRIQWNTDYRRGIQFGMAHRNAQPLTAETDDSIAGVDEAAFGVDLCETDLSDIEVIEIEDARRENLRFRADSPTPNVISHMLEPDRLPMQRHAPLQFQRPDMLTIFSHIHERLRAQAMLLERMQIFAIDSRPRIPPSVVLQGLAVRRIQNQQCATELGSCPICLEPYKPRMMVRILPKCQHWIHKTCMDKWITKSHRLTCPLDNIPIEVETASIPPNPSQDTEVTLRPPHSRAPIRPSVSSVRSTATLQPSGGRILRRSSRIQNGRQNRRQ